MNIHFYVTHADIVNGTIGCAKACPVALSIKRRLKATVEVYSTFADVYNAQGAYHRIHQLPAKVQDFILKYDANGDVSPMRFQLNISDKTLAQLSADSKITGDRRYHD